MFEIEIKKTPMLRFQAYEEEWKQYKLGEISSRITRKNTNLESTLPLTISAQHGLIAQNDFFNKQIASRDISGYFLVEHGEFAYNKSYSKGYPWGTVKRLEKYAKGVLSTLYIVFEPKNVNSSYLAAYYDSFKWHKEVSMRAAEGARNHGLLNITPQDFFETQIFVPTNKDEQEKIGRFFEQIDNMIGLYQRELELLQLEKQTLLSKMFPKEGESVPEIRFNGFTDDWEQRKVGEYYEFKNGLNKGKEFFGTGIPIVNFTDVFHNRGIKPENLNGRVQLEETEIKNFEVKKGDIFFTRTSETIEEIGYPSVMLESPIDTVFSGFVLRGRCILKEDPLENVFKKYIFFTEAFRVEMLKKSSMTTRALTSGTAIKNMVFLHPVSKEEQNKIGEYFTNLDHLITLHQRKLEIIKETKKALLKYMFV